MRNFSSKSCRENQNTRFIACNVFHEIVLFMKSVVEPEGSQTIWRRRDAYWISRATRTKAHARARALTNTRRNIHYLLLFHCNNCFVNAPQCYVTLAVNCTRQQKFDALPGVRFTLFFAYCWQNFHRPSAALTCFSLAARTVYI
jgi:hypothetical protein